MFLKRILSLLLVAAVLVVPALRARSATNLAARVRVDAAGVEVQRTGTAAWIPIKAESIIAAGDHVRTGEKGQATLIFFEGALTALLLSNSEVELRAFNGALDAFTLDIAPLRGFTDYSAGRALKEAERYTISSPVFTVALTRGLINMRIEATSRTAALNITNATANVLWPNGERVALPQNSGVRLSSGESAGEVVTVTSFATLDSALDGCPVSIAVEGDVTLNVRLGADFSFPRVGGIEAKSSLQALGITTVGAWYRIAFGGGFGWINLAKPLQLDRTCAGLRRYPQKYGPENGTPFGLTATPSSPATLAP